MKRVPPSERTKESIEQLLAEGGESGDLRSSLVRLAVQRIVEEALEAGVATCWVEGSTSGGGRVQRATETVIGRGG